MPFDSVRSPAPVTPLRGGGEEGFTVRMIRLWIEHYERLLGFGAGTR